MVGWPRILQESTYILMVPSQDGRIQALHWVPVPYVSKRKRGHSWRIPGRGRSVALQRFLPETWHLIPEGNGHVAFLEHFPTLMWRGQSRTPKSFHFWSTEQCDTCQNHSCSFLLALGPRYLFIPGILKSRFFYFFQHAFFYQHLIPKVLLVWNGVVLLHRNLFFGYM